MTSSPAHITHLEPNQVFVFGSNIGGRHGAGAAKQALGFGAKFGQGIGLAGQTYAIPTKDRSISRTLTVEEISPHVDRFCEVAQARPDLQFLVTEIGCGLAGYKPKHIAPLFEAASKLPNVLLPARFLRYYSHA